MNPVLSKAEQEALAYWVSFRYAVNWHPEQVASWYAQFGADAAPLKTTWLQVIDRLHGAGLIWLADPSFSSNIWRIHPELSIWMKDHLNSGTVPGMASAFYNYYLGVAESLHELLISQDKSEREAGLTIARLERFNFHHCLFEALKEGKGFSPFFSVLFLQLFVLDHLNQAVHLCNQVMPYLKTADLVERTTEQKLEWMGVMDALGRILREQKALKEATQLFEEMDKAYQSDHRLQETFPTGWGEVTRQLGILALESGATETGKQLLDNALSMHQQLGDKRAIALVHEHLARYFFETGALNIALESIDKAYEQADKDRDDIHLLNASQIKAGILYALEQANESRLLYEICVEMGERLGQPFSVAKAYQGLGLLNSAAGNFSESLKQYRQALENFLAMPTVFSFDIAQIYHNMANDYYHLEAYSESEEYYRRAERVYEKIGLKDKQAEIAQNLGNVWYYLEDMTQSMQFDRRAAVLHAELGHMKELSDILENTIQLARDRNDPDILRSLLNAIKPYLSEQTCLKLLSDVQRRMDKA